MTRHYTITSFFRQMPNALLKRYFAKRGLLTDFDFEAMKETKIDPLMEAWLGLPAEQRKEMEAEFREIFELSCEKGAKAIIDEARWQLRETPKSLQQFVERLSDLPSHYHRAMVTFLEHPECWKGATLFYHADTLPYWRKRKNMGHNSPASDKESLERLARELGEYFRLTEGRGRNCKVEAYRRGEFVYFFAYPEDYAQQSVEWVDGEFQIRPHNPAFEVVYVYSRKEGTLDLNFRGSRKAVEPLQAIFATTILKLDELPPDPKDERVYDFSPLIDRDFEFAIEPDSGIESVAISKLRLSSRIIRGERITLEANPDGNSHAIHDLWNRMQETLPPDLYHITQVELVATVREAPDKPPRKVRFRVTYPNSCSLKYDKYGLALREVLTASGLEPREVVESEDASETDQDT